MTPPDSTALDAPWHAQVTPIFDTGTYTSWQLLQRELERTLTDAPTLPEQ